MWQVQWTIIVSCILFVTDKEISAVHFILLFRSVYEFRPYAQVHVVRVQAGFTVMAWLILHSWPTLNPHPIRTGPQTYGAYKWAAACQNQQTNLGAQQRLRSTSASTQSDQSLRSLCVQWIAKNTKGSSCGQRRLWSYFADAQPDLSLPWAHISFCWFCCVAFSCLKWNLVTFDIYWASKILHHERDP